MMWVLRPGKQGVYYDKFLSEKKVFLPWERYNVDLCLLKDRDDFRQLVVNEKNPEARTTISNWSAQLYSFCYEMNDEDYVLIPTKRSKNFAIVKLKGGYIYDAKGAFHHFRKYDLIVEGVPRESFEQNTQYSLGAFRTLFKVKQENEILQVMQEFLAKVDR